MYGILSFPVLRASRVELLARQLRVSPRWHALDILYLVVRPGRLFAEQPPPSVEVALFDDLRRGEG